ncbi:acyltransferase [Microbacterium sp. BDGP8]|uniref:acyltransferase family protein n=1 Tax=Microbacterium sp. BDGP8 TaxID=3035531 RepID=UPI00249E2548|nr:acyltransferase [Microbacterium sp. BDGP8]WHE35758.1 acyltransferase [Microbacterium sp. BDGP8]
MTPIEKPSGRVNLAMNAVRFIAAVLVVIFHLRTLFIEDYSQVVDPSPVTTGIYAFASLGHQAVIVFFVLSGYWVGGSVIRALQQERFSAGVYASARLVRLWLVLVPAIALTLMLDAIGFAARPQSDIYSGSVAYHSLLPAEGVGSRSGPGEVIGNALFLQDVYVQPLGSNSPLWSLAAEFWYYVSFPALLILVWRGVSIRARATAAAVVFVAVAAIAAGPLEGHARVALLAPTWAIGAAVAAMRGPVSRKLLSMSRLSSTILQVGLGMLVLGAAVVDSRVWSTGTTYFLAIATALWLASLVVDAPYPVVGRALAPISWSAEWSYSLYAIHMPVLTLIAALLVPRASDRWAISPLTVGLCAVLTLSVMAVAMAFYFCFERNTNAVRGFLRRIPNSAVVS